MRVVITAATVGEWMPAFLEINKLYTAESNRFKVSFHQAGVGLLASSVSLTRLILEEKPDLIIQAGIAGTFNTNLELGNVLVIKDEILGDTGVEENGKWKDIFDMQLEKPGHPPFESKKLINHWLPKFNLLHLPEVSAITVNEITTNNERIIQLVKKYKPVTESMEGAALHYTCKLLNTPFIQIRALSNYIGERNKVNWLIKEALKNLNQTVLDYVDELYKMQ